MQYTDDELDKNKKPVHILFEGKDFRLSWQYLQQQVDTGIVRRRSWSDPDLQFVSFTGGQFVLKNSKDGRSYRLSLQVTGNELLVTCGCEEKGATLCEHGYNALRSIIFFLGEHYFQKLRPGGVMELALGHKTHFNKVESRSGLDVSPRPELKTVYKLDEKAGAIDLAAVMELPGTLPENNFLSAGEALSYVVILPNRHRFLPAVIPCMGKLNKNGTTIKSFDKFLSGLQKEYAAKLTHNQRELNKACFSLWKTVEPLPGSLMDEAERKSILDNYIAIRSAWQQLIPLLQKQPFVYSYPSYHLRDLKGKPRMGRIAPVQLSGEPPTLKFVLTEKAAFYTLELQIWIHNDLLEGYDAEVPFFILYGRTLYLLESFRDAVIAEWMYRSGGRITIFKEHFGEFEKDWLTLIWANYPLKMITAKLPKSKARETV